MKHIMIVTASTGGGHNSAANNLKHSFEERGIYCQMIDMFKATSKASNYMMVEGYRVLAEKMPKTYGALYDFVNHKSVNKIIFNSFFIQTGIRLSWLFQEFEPDLVIATHAFGAQLIGKLKQKGRLNVPFMQIVTDFKAHYTYMHHEVDAYIVPSEYTRDTLVENGADKNKIYVYGIPIKEEFYTNAVRMFSDGEPLHLLIMGGSMGMNGIAEVIQALLSLEFQNNLRMSVVCANNNALYERLNTLYSDRIRNDQMHVYGFVDNMHELMESCDLIISKPGGLTTSEAIHKCVPMIIPFVIPGQEQENAEFLVEHNMAIEVKDIDQLGQYLKELIDHPEMYKEMVANMERLNKSYSIDSIVELGTSMING